jgi:hypothetical protein
LIVKDVDPAVLKRYLDQYADWRSRRTAALDSGRQSSILVMTATEAAASDLLLDVDGIAVTVETIDAAAVRPGGARFGALVHALLSDVPLSAGSDDMLGRLADIHARVLGADASAPTPVSTWPRASWSVERSRIRS